MIRFVTVALLIGSVVVSSPPQYAVVEQKNYIGWNGGLTSLYEDNHLANGEWTVFFSNRDEAEEWIRDNFKTPKPRDRELDSLYADLEGDYPGRELSYKYYVLRVEAIWVSKEPETDPEWLKIIYDEKEEK